MDKGVVTVSARGGDAEHRRATMIAANTGWKYVERRGALPALLRGQAVDLAYVVARQQEFLTDGASRLSVDLGLLHAKQSAGLQHPLMRALGPARRVFDGTLGLAGDALHIAAVLGAEVVGAEASPVVFELVCAGLRRIEHPAVRSIRPFKGLSHLVFQEQGPFDVVFLAPMFQRPAKAAPGFDLFRRVADPRALEPSGWENTRVVVRVEKGEPAPFPKMEAVAGRKVDYWVSRPTGE